MMRKSQDFRDKGASQNRPFDVTGSIILPFLDLCFCMGPDTLGAMEKNSLPSLGTIKQVSTSEARSLRPVWNREVFHLATY